MSLGMEDGQVSYNEFCDALLDEDLFLRAGKKLRQRTTVCTVGRSRAGPSENSDNPYPLIKGVL